MGPLRTGRALDCHFVGYGEKLEKPPYSPSLSRPVDTLVVPLDECP